MGNHDRAERQRPRQPRRKGHHPGKEDQHGDAHIAQLSEYALIAINGCRINSHQTNRHDGQGDEQQRPINMSDQLPPGALQSTNDINHPGSLPSGSQPSLTGVSLACIIILRYRPQSQCCLLWLRLPGACRAGSSQSPCGQLAQQTGHRSHRFQPVRPGRFWVCQPGQRQ